jgi:glycosyltransferase involved in cell wall biosynthesis
MQATPLKVLALPKYPLDGASSRYCVHQFIPWLERSGLHCSVMPFMDDELYRLSQGGGNHWQKLWRALSATLRRLRLPFIAHRYDVIFIQRELIPALPPVLEWLLAKLGTPLVFIYDDALFIRKDNIHNPLLRLLKRPHYILSVFRQVDCVIGTNRYLRDYAARYARRAEYLALPEDLDLVRPKSYAQRSHGPAVIGWFGSPSTEKYLHLLDEVFTELASCCDFELHIVGGGSFQHEHCKVVHKTWSLSGETADLHSFDIGIMPLPPEEWSQGKSGGKARTYMAAALPAVCTDIGHNRDLIDHRQTGFLVTEPEDWITTLQQLIADPGLRQRVGEQARQHLEHHLSLPGQARQLQGILESVCQQS